MHNEKKVSLSDSLKPQLHMVMNINWMINIYLTWTPTSSMSNSGGSISNCSSFRPFCAKNWNLKTNWKRKLNTHDCYYNNSSDKKNKICQGSRQVSKVPRCNAKKKIYYSLEKSKPPQNILFSYAKPHIHVASLSKKQNPQRVNKSQPARNYKTFTLPTPSSKKSYCKLQNCQLPAYFDKAEHPQLLRPLCKFSILLSWVYLKNVISFYVKMDPKANI